MSGPDEGSQLLDIVSVTPDEVTPFEVDTQGANIVVMDQDNYDDFGNLKVLDNLKILDLYYK